VLGKEPPRRLGDEEPGSQLLALSQAQFTVHVVRLPETS
jgi:hypothetical protein